MIDYHELVSDQRKEVSQGTVVYQNSKLYSPTKYSQKKKRRGWPKKRKKDLTK
jgi:hypothetical protein